MQQIFCDDIALLGDADIQQIEHCQYDNNAANVANPLGTLETTDGQDDLNQLEQQEEQPDVVIAKQSLCNVVDGRAAQPCLEAIPYNCGQSSDHNRHDVALGAEGALQLYCIRCAGLVAELVVQADAHNQNGGTNQYCQEQL